MSFVRRKRQRRYRTEADIWFAAARECALHSTCVRRRVGAVLVSPLHGAVSFGWNLEKDGALCEEDCPRSRYTHQELPAGSPFHGNGRCIATHAEMMAIERAETLSLPQLRRFHIYVTYRPCGDCQAVLDELEIEVHYEREYA